MENIRMGNPAASDREGHRKLPVVAAVMTYREDPERRRTKLKSRPLAAVYLAGASADYIAVPAFRRCADSYLG